jgi:hypothetical protein
MDHHLRASAACVEAEEREDDGLDVVDGGLVRGRDCGV